MDLKVNAAVEKIWTPSTVSSFSFTKNPSWKDFLKVPKELTDVDNSNDITKQTARLLLSFSLSIQIGELLTKWLTGSGGGLQEISWSSADSQENFSNFAKKMKRNWFLNSWTLACVLILCFSSLSTTCEINTSSDTVDDWVTLMPSLNWSTSEPSSDRRIDSWRGQISKRRDG